jgi:hypothetical protein
MGIDRPTNFARDAAFICAGELDELAMLCRVNNGGEMLSL